MARDSASDPDQEYNTLWGRKRLLHYTLWGRKRFLLHILSDESSIPFHSTSNGYNKEKRLDYQISL